MQTSATARALEITEILEAILGSTQPIPGSLYTVYKSRWNPASLAIRGACKRWKTTFDEQLVASCT
jgi:hypothetical protein